MSISKNGIVTTQEIYGGSLFKIVGNEVIISKDGIASGFTVNSYISGTKEIDLTNADSFEIHSKFTIGIINSTYQRILESMDIAPHFIWRIDSNNSFVWNLGDGANEWTSLDFCSKDVLQPNTTYWVKLVYKNEVATGYISTNGIDFIKESSWSGSAIIGKFVLRVGLGRGNADPFLGSIDLTSIKFIKNGVVIFNGLDAFYSGNKIGICKNKIYTKNLYEN